MVDGSLGLCIGFLEARGWAVGFHTLPSLTASRHHLPSGHAHEKFVDHWGSCTKLLWALSVHCPCQHSFLPISFRACSKSPTYQFFSISPTQHSQAPRSVLRTSMLVLFWGPYGVISYSRYLNLMQIQFLLICKIHSVDELCWLCVPTRTLHPSIQETPAVDGCHQY